MPAVSPAGPTRRDPRMLWIAAAVLLAARIVLGIVEERNPPQRPDLMMWVEPADAVAEAKRTGRPILYDFTADWCAPCQDMRQEMFAQERYAQALGHLVVPVRVLDRQQEEGRNSAVVDSLQQAHKITGFPTLVIVGLDGKAVDQLVGFPGSDAVLGWATATARRTRAQDTGVKLQFP